MRVNLKIPWLVFASALMTLLLFGLADAQDGSLDQEAIEQALRDALPKNSEIMIPFDEIERDSEIGGWKSPDPNIFGVTYVRAGYKQFQCPKNEIWEPKDYFHVSIMLESRDRKHPPYPLEEDYRAQNQKFYSEVVPERYEGLPGGTISERLLSLEPDEYQNIYCTIAFWKSPLYDGTVELWAQVNNRDTQGCQPSYATRKAEAKKLIRSECERLAKLVWSRLPGDDVAQQSVLSGVEGGNVAGSQVQSFQEEAQAKMKEFEGEGPKAFENVPQQEFIGLSGIGKSIIQQAIFQEKLREYQEYGMHGYSLLITDEPSLNYDNSLTTLRHKEIYLPKMKSAFNSGTEEGYRQVIDLFYKAMEEDVTTATKRHESESKKSRTDEDKEDAVQNAPAARKYINERGKETYKPAPVK
jgi:hypothetical protein